MTLINILGTLFGIRNKFGINLLTKIRVSFLDLRDHRSNDNLNCESSMCSCSFEDETSVHCFLRCSRHTAQRTVLRSRISDIIGTDVSVLPDEYLYHILIYGNNV